MATHPALLPSKFDWLIIRQDRNGFSCQTKLKTRIAQNYLKILRKLRLGYKTKGNAFDKTHEQLFFGKLWASFPTIFGKFENQQKILGKRFRNNFVKNNFSDNCGKILGECSEYFRFCHKINYLLTGLLVPCRAVKYQALVYYART